MLNKFFKLLGITLLCLSLFSFYQKESKTPVVVTEILATNKNETPKTNHEHVLVIDKVGILTNIYPAVQKEGEWQPDSRGVSIHQNVIYGHNWNSILGNLVNVKPGMIVEIRNKDSVKKYVVDFTQEIDPKSYDVVNQNTDNKIVIYTCSGIFDTKRFVVVASKIS